MGVSSVFMLCMGVFGMPDAGVWILKKLIFNFSEIFSALGFVYGFLSKLAGCLQIHGFEEFREVFGSILKRKSKMKV